MQALSVTLPTVESEEILQVINDVVMVTSNRYFTFMR